jgi:hypothetical protein
MMYETVNTKAEKKILELRYVGREVTRQQNISTDVRKK